MSELIDSSNARILIADDEASLRTVLATSLRRAGFRVSSAKNGKEALALLQAAQKHEEDDPFSLLIADVKMPEMDGMTLLEKAHEVQSDLIVVMLTAHGTVDLAVSALKRGAFDFLTKPYERDEFLAVIKKALGQQGALHTKANAEDGFGRLVGSSRCIKQVKDIIAKVADTPSTVLITGESGTGKEIVAHAIHENSSRKDKPFIRINCAAIPHALLEAELFGYEKGAFTGAISSKPGRFELADEGTLFLDEIGELPVEMQAKLLRVLQDSCLERVGGIKTIQLNVRLIAATNLNLQKAVQDGRFREDLFYRLNVVPIHLPALSERTEDIKALLAHFVHKFNQKLNKSIEGFTDQALEVLVQYTWPGNVRELENVAERSILFAQASMIDACDLPPELLAHLKFNVRVLKEAAEGLQKDASMKDIVRQATIHIERDLMLQALQETSGNVTRAAQKLKISRKSLQSKMKEHGLRMETEAQL